MTTSDARPALKLDPGQASQEMPPPPTTDILAVAAATPSTETPRPILKLNTASRKSSFSSDLATPSGEKKTIRIKVSLSQPGTPAITTPLSASSTKTKAGRSTKPTEKLLQSKKRAYDSDDDDDAPMAASRKSSKIKTINLKRPAKGQATTAFSVQTPTGAAIRIRPKGEPVKHEPGDAYDSEASDREADPTRENLMVLRALPGSSTEYLRKAIQDGTIGLPASNGGADFKMQWIDGKERRAMLTINGINYAAILVDLPTITEAMKTWDRKSMVKHSDITQMLLCFHEVRDETEARTIALPSMAQQAELKWPHGLTPPMHDAVNRRFRKTMSEKQLASAANTVKKLIADDNLAIESSFEFVQDNEEEDLLDSGGEEDAEGEEEDIGYFPPQPEVLPNDFEDMDDLEAELEAELEMNSATPATQMEATTPMTMEATTPALPLGELSDGEAEEEEEEISDEDDDDDDDDELDDDELAKQAESREVKQEMLEFEKRKRDLESQMEAVTNPLMRKRIQTNIFSLQKEIDLRRAKLDMKDDE